MFHNRLLFVAVADRMCRSGAIDLICIDSVSALTPRAEIEVIFLYFLFCFFLTLLPYGHRIQYSL